MSSVLSRRSLLKRTALAGGALAVTPLATSSRLLAAGSSDKVNCVVIGCGGRGMSHLSAVMGENLWAIVDVDEKRHAAVQKALAAKNYDAGKVQMFTDYRVMFDKLAKQINA